MPKVKQFITKYWFVFAIVIVILIRLILSANLSSFYLSNLRYDDKLMINQLNSLKNGEYLGKYKDITLVKGVAYPIFLYVTSVLNLNNSMMLTIMYILVCLYFMCSLRKLINSEAIPFIIFTFLLLNPATFSSDLFQRLYRNSLTILETILFFGTVINIICHNYSEKKFSLPWFKIYIDYIFLGIITGIMFLTREDTIWVILVYVILIIYKLYKNFKIKTVLQLSIPILVTIILLNIVCYINYKNYGVYTYNEITNSAFKNAYIKILQIKDDEKKDKIAIPKSTLYRLSENSKLFNLPKEFIDKKYRQLSGGTDEIYNGNIVWYLRYWIYQKNDIKTGEQANKYWKELANEIDNLFKEGKLEKEWVIPSTKLNTPTQNEIQELPQNLKNTIVYTTTYQNVKTFSRIDLEKNGEYDEEVNAFKISYKDYHNAENIIENNPLEYEIIRNIYKYFTIIFSIITLVIYIKNIKIKDKINLILHIIVLTYLVIICGVTYTHTTAHDAIRYCYLGNIYILQSIFILLNLYRIYDKYKYKNIKLLESGGQNGFSNNSSIQ